MASGKLLSACCCAYYSIDCEDCVCGCTDSTECLCCIHDACLSINCKENLGCGCVTDEGNNECCKLGCCFCRAGLKSPDALCSCASQLLCLKHVCACPFNDRFLNECVCAMCCIACAPECGCCIDAPPCPALNDNAVLKGMKMER